MMRIGQLIQFSDDGQWTDVIAGKLGLVVAVRPSGDVREGRDQEWDCFINDRIEAGFVCDFTYYFEDGRVINDIP
jgi:hypothetical protein